MSMSVVAARVMSKPPPPPGKQNKKPNPPTTKHNGKPLPPAPPSKSRPRPPNGRPAPPKPPSGAPLKRMNGNTNAHKAGSPPAVKRPPPPNNHKRPAPAPPSTAGVKKVRRAGFGKMSFQRPKVLRDVSAFSREKKVGQGTYGSVFMGVDKVTKERVALKLINTEQEENGFPITAIREVKILKALSHKNIVKLNEIVTSKETNGQNEGVPRNVYLVFEYHEFDLTGILQSKEIRLTQDHIKSWAYQLLEGTHYMHLNKIIHRDLKASNILIGRNGELKIADWGLARSWSESMKRLTNGVVTRWYRPIELLLGCTKYTPKVDMWSVGCIIAEMFRRDCLLKGGDSEASQLQLIFETCGHPNTNEWPDIHKVCPLWKNFEPRPDEALLPCSLAKVLRKNLPNPSWMTNHAIDLIKQLLAHNPDKRYSAQDGLRHDYFHFEKPELKEPKDLFMRFKPVHELDIREQYMRRHNIAAKP